MVKQGAGRKQEGKKDFKPFNLTLHRQEDNISEKKI